MACWSEFSRLPYPEAITIARKLNDIPCGICIACRDIEYKCYRLLRTHSSPIFAPFRILSSQHPNKYIIDTNSVPVQCSSGAIANAVSFRSVCPQFISYASRATKFAPVKSIRFSELNLGILLSELCFTVFFPLGCGVDSWIPPFQFFQTAKGKAPIEAWGGYLSGWGINLSFLHPHEPQLSAIYCVKLNEIDPSYMICIRSFMILYPHYSTLTSPLPIRCDKISRKGQVFRSFVLIGFMRQLFEV